MTAPARNDLEPMGIPYVPLTFPTVTVQNYMRLGGVEASTAEVDYLWTAYKDAVVKDGVTPYSPDRSGGENLPIIVALQEKTKYDRGKVVAYLNAVVKAVNNGWGWRWLDPKKSMEVGKDVVESIKGVFQGTGEAVGSFLKPVADPITNLVKYAAIGIVGGAIIYGIFQYRQVTKVKRRVTKGK